MDAAPDGWLRGLVGDFDIVNFYLLEVADEDDVFDGSVAFDAGARAIAVVVEDYGCVGGAGSAGLELFVPDGTVVEEDMVAWFEIGPIDF